MEADQPLHTRSGCECKRVTDGAVPPPDVILVLDIAVLSVVNEKVHPSSQAEPGGPVRFAWKVMHAEGRLVIGYVRDYRGIFSDPVADSWPRVAYQVRRDRQAADREAPEGHVVEREGTRKVAKEHRREGR